MAVYLIVLHGIEAVVVALNDQRMHSDRTGQADVDVVFPADARGGDQIGTDLMRYLVVMQG